MVTSKHYKIYKQKFQKGDIIMRNDPSETQEIFKIIRVYSGEQQTAFYDMTIIRNSNNGKEDGFLKGAEAFSIDMDYVLTPQCSLTKKLKMIS